MGVKFKQIFGGGGWVRCLQELKGEKEELSSEL